MINTRPEFQHDRIWLGGQLFSRHDEKYLLRLSPAFEDEDVSVDVLHADPAGQRQRRVGPNPVHHGPQLRQERHQAEAGNDTVKCHVDDLDSESCDIVWLHMSWHAHLLAM